MSLKKIGLLVFLLALVSTGIVWFLEYSHKKEFITDKMLPKIQVAQVLVTHITDEEVKLLLTLSTDNPLPLGVTLDSLRYALYIENQEVITSTYTKQVKIKGGQVFPLSLPVTVFQKKMKALLEGLETLGKDSVEYKIKGTVFHTLLSKEGLSFEMSKRMPLLHIPTVKIVHTRFERTLKGLLVTLSAKLGNKNAFGIHLLNTQYSIKLENHKTFEGKITQIKVEPKDSTEFQVPLEIDFKEVGFTIQDYAKKGGQLGYDFKMKSYLESQQKTINGTLLNIIAKGTLKELKEAQK